MNSAVKFKNESLREGLKVSEIKNQELIKLLQEAEEQKKKIDKNINKADVLMNLFMAKSWEDQDNKLCYHIGLSEMMQEMVEELVDIDSAYGNLTKFIKENQIID